MVFSSYSARTFHMFTYYGKAPPPLIATTFACYCASRPKEGLLKYSGILIKRLSFFTHHMNKKRTLREEQEERSPSVKQLQGCSDLLVSGFSSNVSSVAGLFKTSQSTISVIHQKVLEFLSKLRLFISKLAILMEDLIIIPHHAVQLIKELAVGCSEIRVIAETRSQKADFMDQRNGLELVHSIRSKDAAIGEGGDVVLCHVVVSLEGRWVWRCNISNAGNVTWLHGYNSSGKRKQVSDLYYSSSRVPIEASGNFPVSGQRVSPFVQAPGRR
ncbi:hypothetical protein COCNU_01G014160 [Cocos nucifera]|uniref:Uncharacterized protein n=1 Tax=Cocos nucifera TaxID=13894 RepID=A0A8K0HVL0_COCNU|nr:hypothetical protein COCNU_01G014160 [Cocos nucifera]